MSEAKATELISSQSLVCEPERSLNDIPDAILRHILSYLSTKYAVRTSALSKRWRYLWTSRSNLDFQEEVWKFSRYNPQDHMTVFYGSKRNPKTRSKSRNRESFINFVERVLFYPDDAPREIQKFSLCCDIYQDDNIPRIQKWISTAVMRNTQEFNIYIYNLSYHGDNNVFPDCLFTSETVEVLKIEINVGDMKPSLVCLPHLKVLTLKNVHLKDHHSTTLLFASPALEVLVMHNCPFAWYAKDDEVENMVIISAPMLRSLTIDEPMNNSYGDCVTISSPALENFNIRGLFHKQYHFCNSSSISKASLGFHKFVKLKTLRFYHFDEVFNSLKSVKFLELSTDVFKFLSHTTVPVFKNLMTLEIPEEVDLGYHGSKSLVLMLNKCPSFETLRFRLGFSETYNYDVLLNSKFICSSPKLKNIIIGCFDGHSKELSAMHILLEKAAFLETLEINFAKNVEKREEIENLLSAIPRASNSCKLCFKWPK